MINTSPAYIRFLYVFLLVKEAFGRGVISEKEYDDFLKDLIHLEDEFGGILPEGSVTCNDK